MKTATITLYEFDELSEKAKDKAREWMREGTDNWSDQVEEDAAQVGLKITGWDIDRGASCDLEVLHSYGQTAEAILENHGETCGTYVAAKAFKEATAHMQEEDQDARDEAAEVFHKALEGEYLQMLRDQYQEELYGETLDETIRINNYTFLESGERFEA